MISPTRARSFALLFVGFISAGWSLPAAAQTGSGRTAGLTIVVVEGEDAVNIVQQKTAVAPVVEVRDRNDQPVAGVVVRFAIRSGRASFNGARALTVTTNAAGRAMVTGLTPTGSGALQISASAAFQGQTAAVTIAQTNVMSAAEAATVSSAGAAGGGGGAGAGGTGAGGAAGGGAGGGLSATTIGIVGGAAAGGALAAKEVLGGNQTTYHGTYSGPWRLNQGPTCTTDIMESGTVTLQIATSDSGAVSGQGHVSSTHTFVSIPASCGQPAPGSGAPQTGSVVSHGGDGPVSGSTTGFGFTASHPGTFGAVYRYDFSGAFNGAEIGGTFTLTVTVPNAPGGAVSFAITLH